MDAEQCIEMMKALSRTFTQISQQGDVVEDDIYRLRHILLELQLSMISMEKSVKNMIEKDKCKKMGVTEVNVDMIKEASDS